MVFCRFVRACGERTVAHVAQLVEHVLGKDEVIGSNPIMGSKLERHNTTEMMMSMMRSERRG